MRNLYSLKSQGSLLKPVDFEAERKKLEQKYDRKITDEDLISALIYPKVIDSFETIQNHKTVPRGRED
jgi:pyruvate carboxylase